MTFKILRRPEVLSLTGLSTSTIYAMMARSAFPRPVKLSTRAVGWHEQDIIEWIEARAEVAR
jgi:prophage regulatory protein